MKENLDPEDHERQALAKIGLIREATKEHNPIDVCPNVADLSKTLEDRTSTQISPRTVQRRLYEKNFKKFPAPICKALSSLHSGPMEKDCLIICLAPSQ